VRGAHRKASRTFPDIQAATYGADMRHFVNHSPIPCLMYGAGDVKLAHHVNESIPVDDLMTATKTIALSVVDWCDDSLGFSGSRSD
jgi:acetylornithine deacetylase